MHFIKRNEVNLYTMKGILSTIHFKWGKKDSEWYCMMPFVEQNEAGGRE